MDYSKMKRVINWCKLNPEKFDPYCPICERGKFSFIGVAAMFELGLDPLTQGTKTRLAEGLLPTVDKAQSYLELDMFATALLWSYPITADLALAEKLIDLYVFGKSIEIDGLEITKKDLRFI